MQAIDYSKAKTAETQSEADKSESLRIFNRWESLDSDAVNFKSHWQDCYENIVPRKEDVVTERMAGDRRNSDLYDTTAILANEMLASALHGMLTNPETRFFELTYGDPKLDEDQAVKEWCQDVGNRMFRVLNNTNFQTEIYEIYVDLGAIGTACLYMGEHEENIVHFSARAMKEIRVDENSLGLIDIVYRKFKWTPRQIVAEFGQENCPIEVLRAYEKESNDRMDVIHAVEPHDDKQNPAGHKFKSTYILCNPKFILSKKGYRTFPYGVPRWSKVTGEKYGRGPGMAMLPDIMMINSMMLTLIQGAQKTVDPPLQVQDDGVIGQVRLTPGGLTIVRAGSEPIRPLITDARIDFGQQVVEDVRNRIRSGFFVDQLTLQKGPQMTAEEVIQRTEQQLRLMGPVLGRQHFELLKPLITRLFDIMQRRGLIPPVPAVVQGKKFDVRYSSLIARAQRMNEGKDLARALQLLAPMTQIKPHIADVIDEEAVARYVWDVYGLNHKLLLTKRALDNKRKQIAQAQADQAKMIQEQHQAEVMNKAAPAMAVMQQQGKNQNAPQTQ